MEFLRKSFLKEHLKVSREKSLKEFFGTEEHFEIIPEGVLPERIQREDPEGIHKKFIEETHDKSVLVSV